MEKQIERSPNSHKKTVNDNVSIISEHAKAICKCGDQTSWYTNSHKQYVSV